MKHNTFYYIFKDFQDRYNLARFKAKWRKNNQHNMTIPMNIWPEDKVTVGRYTYGNFECFFFGTKDNSEYIRIGNSCSIASDTKFLAGGEHRFNTLTMFPYFQKYINKTDYAAYSKGPIIVEDEVWIGKGCTILSGVKIGKGAVIGAGSVVAHDVPPFAIVGGAPAKIIKYRFEKNIIDKLLSVEYSNLDIEIIKNNKALFTTPIDTNTIEALMILLQKLNNSSME